MQMEKTKSRIPVRRQKPKLGNKNGDKESRLEQQDKDVFSVAQKVQKGVNIACIYMFNGISKLMLLLIFLYFNILCRYI